MTDTLFDIPESAPKLKCVVTFSSGIGSWGAAKRCVEKHGAENVTLLFADTMIEDEDNYRFLHQAVENVGAKLVTIADGRTPWQVMTDARIIGNSRIDPCSSVLKRKLMDKWRNEHCDSDTEIAFGLSWDESHRFERTRSRNPKWNYTAPLCDAPYLTKNDLLSWARSEGLEPPRLYGMGFPHANCGGFCIKAGQASFALLLKNFPERYKHHEEEEEKLRGIVGDHTILKLSRKGETKKITLKEFREMVESKQEYDEFEFGGCGCALPI
jgi:3'-phosphoadenosine 5'-phosphosulfate sulfotransferase (PAPS reductase)/FAD synthetase